MKAINDITLLGSGRDSEKVESSRLLEKMKRLLLCVLVIDLIVPLCAGAAIENIRVSNNTPAGVTISWTTDSSVMGEVHYSQNPSLSNPTTAFDVDQFIPGCTHYVYIDGLTELTTYYFEVKAGTETDDNEGNYYTFSTMGQPSSPPPLCTISGCVYEEDGTTLAEDAIVYLRVTHGGVESYPLSDHFFDYLNPGCFLFNIKEARSTVTDNLFPSIDPGDPIHIEAVDCGNYRVDWDQGFDGCFRNIGFLTLGPDADNDNIPDDRDNCPHYPNGTLLGTCIQGNIGTPCTSNEACNVEFVEGFCSMNQEDTYPPLGNGIGDACDCEGDFDCDGDVDTFDMVAFLTDFGRNGYINPCTGANPCNSDFSCDGDVDTFDMVTFMEDFGRGFYVQPCPACEGGDWCSY